MLNRLKKKLHKLKNPQMEFPLNGIGAEPQFEIITFGPENNDLLFFFKMKMEADHKCSVVMG